MNVKDRYKLTNQEIEDDIAEGARARKHAKKPDKHIELTGLKIVPLPSKSTEFELRSLMKQEIIPSFPTTTCIVGGTGSGKSSLLVQMFLNHSMYRGFFNKIYMFASTAESDALFELLELKDSQVFSKDLIKNLDKLVEEIQEFCEKNDPKKWPYIAIIFEDLSAEAKLQRSESFRRLFTANRHMGVSVFCCYHKYKALSALCRNQAHNVIYYPTPDTDQAHLMEDTRPPQLTKKEYIDMIKYAHTPDENNKKPFFYINRRAPIEKRFRKNFNMILQLTPVGQQQIQSSARRATRRGNSAEEVDKQQQPQERDH